MIARCNYRTIPIRKPSESLPGVVIVRWHLQCTTAPCSENCREQCLWLFTHASWVSGTNR